MRRGQYSQEVEFLSHQIFNYSVSVYTNLPFFPVNILKIEVFISNYIAGIIILVRKFRTFDSRFLPHPQSHLILHIVQIKSNAKMRFSRL